MIYLLRGDDTDFGGVQNVTIKIVTNNVTTGLSAHVELLGWTQDFATIPSSKELNVAIPHSATEGFALGGSYGKLWLTDSDGRVRTISRTLPFYVTNDISAAYAPDAEHEIEVQW